MRDFISRIALIPARGGSKGVPLKNLQKVGDHSLLVRALKVAQDSNLFDEICVSSDNAQILEEAHNFGAQIHFLRPKSISLDTTLQTEVISHALDFFATRNQRFETLTLLQPTSPFRSIRDLVTAQKLFEETGANTLISVEDASRFNDTSLYDAPKSSKNLLVDLVSRTVLPSEKMGTLRQDFKQQFWRNGSLYIFRLDNHVIGDELLRPPIVGYVMDHLKSINIDSPEDLLLARLVEPYMRTILNP